MPLSKEKVFSPAVEDYLKTIYELQQVESPVSTNGLAQEMRTTPAAVTKMLKHLAEIKLVEHTPYYGACLTPSGEKVALEIIRHHRLLELYLHQALGYDWDEVDAEAEKLEHHISEEFEERIDRMLNYPLTDPHGDPIPTRDGTIASQRGSSLVEAEAGDTLVILRVSDRDPEALRRLASLGMRLGTALRVMERQKVDGQLTLHIGGETHHIGRELAGHVFVERVTETETEK